MQSFDAFKSIRFGFFELRDTSGLSVQISSGIYPVYPMISRFFFGDSYIGPQMLKMLTDI